MSGIKVVQSYHYFPAYKTMLKMIPAVPLSAGGDVLIVLPL